jgi:methionine salvage enolase-phosphatase E1
MSRPKKKEISLSKDSILSLLQEIYNELVEQRSTAIRVQNKMLSLLKDAEDMKEIGPVLEKQQRIINECVEKKLTLAKLQSAIWEKSNVQDDNMSLTDIDDDMLQSLIKKDIESIDTDKPYSLK